MEADDLRNSAGNIDLGNDLSGVVVGLALTLLILIAAPVVVLVLAAGLFTVELPLVALLAVLLLIARFTGIIPWTVLILNSASGDERRESVPDHLARHVAHQGDQSRQPSEGALGLGVGPQRRGDRVAVVRVVGVIASALCANAQPLPRSLGRSRAFALVGLAHSSG